MTVISNATEETGRAVFRLNADGNLEILFEDNQSIWQHRLNDDGAVSTGFNLQESSDQSGRAHFTSNGILIPIEEEVGEWDGYYVLVDDSGQSNSIREVRISCSNPDLVVISQILTRHLTERPIQQLQSDTSVQPAMESSQIILNRLTTPFLEIQFS